MRDYNYRKNWNDLLTPEIVKKLTLIHEYKGEQRLFIEAHKDELKELVEIAKVQSTEASNKIEGISTADDRLKNLVQAKTTPRNRDESEIAGYRDVLNTIHENYDYIPINANYILQLHRDLYKFLGNIDGGIFKTSDNIIREMDAEGNEKIRFRPVAAWETPASIDELCKAYNEAKGEADSLLLTMMFILDFLCIHPFNDGNGRMSRLLTLLLLYQSGFIVGKYISIEKIIEGSKETYYEVLQDSSINWHENENDYKPFVNYMLGVIVNAYKEFESRVKLLTNPNLTKADRIRAVIKNHIGAITKSELMEMNPDISDTTIQRTLAALLKCGEIEKIGGGRYTKYVWKLTNDMVTGELKSKIDNLWDIFASGGLVNPLEVIEQITYLMFIHDLDDSDNTRAKESAMLGLPYQSIFSEEVKIGERTIDGSQLKWSVFHDFPADRMYSVMQEWVFPFIKTLHSDKNSAYSKYMDDAIFKLPTPLVLSKVVDSLDEIYKMMNEIQTADVRGDVYEYLLEKIAQSGRNGQFRTPRHIIRMMVEMMDPSSDEVICDPACGTSGFLIAAGEYLKEKKKEEIFFDKQKKEHYMNHMFHGYDMDRTMLRIGAMNMMTHGIENPFIEYRDSLSDQNQDKGKYSLILANPPFKGSLDAESVSGDLLKVCKTKKTELLFLALFVRMLKVGGRCACIVPDGVLFGSSKAHKDIRKEIVENQRLEAVISMPSGVFKPYAGVSTAILIFTKTEHGGTDNVWFYDMTADGFSLDDKRSPIAENDIPDIIERFKNLDKEIDRKRTDKSFMVPKQDIVENGYDLSINKYKEIEYVPVEYPSTIEIMTNIREIEMEIGKEMEELEKLLDL